MSAVKLQSANNVLGAAERGVDAALSFVPRVISMERGGCEKKLQQTVLPVKQPHHKGGAPYIEDT